MRFASFLSDGFVTAIVVNSPERKLSKRTSVNSLKLLLKHGNFLINERFWLLKKISKKHSLSMKKNFKNHRKNLYSSKEKTMI